MRKGGKRKKEKMFVCLSRVDVGVGDEDMYKGACTRRAMIRNGEFEVEGFPGE